MRRSRLLAILACAFLAGGARSPVYGPALNARVFDRAWRLVESHYWNRTLTGDRWLDLRDRYRARIIAAPDRRTLYTLLGEMLAQLGDSHVYAIDPVQLAIGCERERGHAAEGFGFTMLPDEAGDWRVRSLRADGAAVRAGVQIGWIVQAVDGRPVDIDYQPAADARTAFDFGDEAGRPHRLTLAAHAEAALPARRATMGADGVLLLGLDGFDPGADRWMADEIARAAPRAVILDLRDNDGGDADVIARVAGLFFARDRLLVRRIAAHESDQMTRGSGARSWTGPLAVLVGPDSASGAEAFAALIADAGRGLTIGERTAGALTGAALYSLPDGGQLSVSEFDIRTAGGARLEGVGLTPRVVVHPSLADRRAGRDPVLDRARALLRR